tara:strand:- start:19 stop:843 length:825 start_codon:yes stop_codon:yes gene_type:complete
MSSGRADLHSHTTYSDGTMTPQELVQEAVRADLSVLAVTDHDCIDGIAEAAQAATNGLEILPGTEISTAFKRVELHILGLCIDPEDAQLKEQLTEIREGRIRRLRKMLDCLKQFDIEISEEEVMELSGHGTVGRPHVARALVAHKVVKTPEEAFNRFLADDKPCFVQGAKLTPKAAVKMIRSAGGVAVLAHPGRLVPAEWMPELLEAGIQGVEAFHPDHNKQLSDHYCDYAKEHNLVISGGSDAHGHWKTKGPKVGDVTVPIDLVDKLKHVAKA